jgi:hypothetical protein
MPSGGTIMLYLNYPYREVVFAIENQLNMLRTVYAAEDVNKTIDDGS